MIYFVKFEHAMNPLKKVLPTMSSRWFF